VTSKTEIGDEMGENKVKVVFSDSGDGFSYWVEGKNFPWALPRRLDRLLKGAVAIGAAEFTLELAVVGWGPVRWSFLLDREILRDLLIEGAAAEAA